MATVNYNYTRLIQCAEIWVEERTERFKSHPADVVLDQKDYAFALEFFPQIDGKSEDETSVIQLSVQRIDIFSFRRIPSLDII